MRGLLTNYKYLLLGIALVLLGLHLASSSLNQGADTGKTGRFIMQVYAPIHSTVSWPFARTADLMGRYLLLMDLKEENRKLSENNRALRLRIMRLDELEAENKRLRHLQNYKVPREIKPVYAPVIARSLTPESRTLLIGKGTKDGVEKNMVAISPDGLVGHINMVATNSARVLLVTDPGSVIDAVVQRTRATGIVKGKNPTHCSLNFLNRTEDIEVGDLVVSSGLGGVFPSGMTVGQVVKVERETTDMFLYVDVFPAVSFDKLEDVIIIPGAVSPAEPKTEEEPGEEILDYSADDPGDAQ
jgi:rod shape-determining protein MreC